MNDHNEMLAAAVRTYPGRGVDLCRVCNTPTRDHEMKPCPKLGVRVLYAPLPVEGHRSDGACIQCGLPAKRYIRSSKATMYCSVSCSHKRRNERRRRS